MSTREEAIELAREDTQAALAVARKISDPWYRCQALAWVARFAPDADMLRIAKQALETASACEDSYQQVAVSAWPIRALIERGALEQAETAIHSALTLAASIEHAGSRAEALGLLFQAALPGMPAMWKAVLEAILAMPCDPIHWRLRRLLRDALLMVFEADADYSNQCLSRVRNEKARRQIDAAIAEARTMTPRDFFR